MHRMTVVCDAAPVIPRGAKRGITGKAALCGIAETGLLGGGTLQVAGGEKAESACKPGSVEDNHSSATCVAAGL